MFDETKETQNEEQAAESTPVQETANPYLAGTEETVVQENVAEEETIASEEMEQEEVKQEDVQQENPWQATPVASPIPEEPKKNPAVKVAVILAIVAVVLIIAIVALAFSGLFGDKKGKIVQAFKNTMEESETYLKEVWQAESYEGMFEGMESSIEMDLTLPEDITLEAVVDSTEEECDIYMDLGMAGSSLVEIEAYADETQIFFALPEYFDYLFYIDLETLEDDIQVMVDNGMLDSYTADTLIEALEMQDDTVELSDEAIEQLEKDVNAAWAEMFEVLKVREIDSMELTVNDDEVECEGYAIELTAEALADLSEATLEAYQGNDEVMDFLEFVEESYDTDFFTQWLERLEESGEEMREYAEDEEDLELDVNVYLYEEKIARIDIVNPDDEDEVWFAWNIEGGNFPLENTGVEIDIDGTAVEFYRTGSMEDGEYWVEYEFVDEYGTSYVLDTYYVPETGEFEIDLMEDEYWNWLYTYGTIEKTDDHTIEIEIDTFEMDEEEILYGDIVLIDECGDIEKPEGEEEINILTMTEEEWEELIMEAYLALY